MLHGQCELVHIAASQLRVRWWWEMGLIALGVTPCRKLATRAGSPSLSHWAFAVHAATASIVIALLTLIMVELEVSLSGGESLSALQAAMATRPMEIYVVDDRTVRR